MNSRRSSKSGIRLSNFAKVVVSVLVLILGISPLTLFFIRASSKKQVAVEKMKDTPTVKYQDENLSYSTFPNGDVLSGGAS